MQKLSIIASFICLWLTGFISVEQENYVGFFLIFSFGILHGANDLLIFKQINSEKRKSNLAKLLIYYLFVVFLGIALFAIIPFVALTLFIIASAFHFGEQHWSLLKWEISNKVLYLFYILHGLFILFLLFFFNSIEVQKVILSITKVSIPILYFQSFLIISGIGLLSFFILLSVRFEQFKKIILEQLLILAVLALLFHLAGLIWGFAIYFIFWHSIPSLQEQIEFLYSKFTFKNFWLYFKSAFGYWIISLLGIYFLYFLLKNTILFEAVFFSFLAAITFPHVLVILVMFKKKKQKS